MKVSYPDCDEVYHKIVFEQKSIRQISEELNVPRSRVYCVVQHIVSKQSRGKVIQKFLNYNKKYKFKRRKYWKDDNYSLLMGDIK